MCVLNFWKLCYTSLHIHMVISGNSQTTHLCRTRGHTWKMIIGRNERWGMWRLSHLQENVENDVQEFSGEQGSPLFGCLCCISGWLLFGTSSHSNDVSSWNVHFLMILSDCFTLGHQTKVLINNLFGLTFYWLRTTTCFSDTCKHNWWKVMECIYSVTAASLIL